MNSVRIRLGMLLLAAIVPGTHAGSVFKGKDLYAAHCAVCHGPNGRPVMPGAPHFERSQGLVLPDPVLFSRISDGKRAMPGYRGVLKHEDIMDVIAYLRTLR